MQILLALSHVSLNVLKYFKYVYNLWFRFTVAPHSILLPQRKSFQAACWPSLVSFVFGWQQIKFSLVLFFFFLPSRLGSHPLGSCWINRSSRLEPWSFLNVCVTRRTALHANWLQIFSHLTLVLILKYSDSVMMCSTFVWLLHSRCFNSYMFEMATGSSVAPLSFVSSTWEFKNLFQKVIFK